MALIDKLFGKNRSLSQLSRAELRKEEILLTKRRDKLFDKVTKIADGKQKVFQQGRDSSSPELRKALAQDFELKTQEQLMAARELNLRTKELMTVARLRMVKENQESGQAAAGRLNVTARDMSKLAGWMESDTVNQEMYGEKLDALLEIGHEGDKDAIESAGLTEGGRDLMHLWEQLDQGLVDEKAAYAQAEEAARRRAAGGTAGGAPAEREGAAEEAM